MQPRAGRGGGSPGGVAPSLSARGSAGKGRGKVPASGQSPPGHCSPGFPAQGGSARTPPRLGRLLSCTPQPGLGASPHCPPLAGAPASKGMLGSGFVPPSLITALLGLLCPPFCPQKAAPGFVILLSPDPGTGWDGKRGCIPAAAMLGHSPRAERGAGCPPTPNGVVLEAAPLPQPAPLPLPFSSSLPQAAGVVQHRAGTGP